jgi:hypothetical protein
VEAVELFFTTYKNTATAFYSFTAFVGVITAIILRIRTLDKRRIEAAQSKATLEQRNVFQAGYFDVQENRHDAMLDYYIALSEKYHELENKMIALEIKSNFN